MDDQVGKTFLSLGIQHWGQTDAQRKAATDAYLKAAGFKLDADRQEAEAWLRHVLDGMPWGKFETEAEHLELALKERQPSTL